MTTTINADTTNGVKITSDTSGILGLQTNGNTAVTIDGSQNVGVRVTPSNWSADYVGLQVRNASLASYTSGAYTWVGSNWYNNSGNKYIGTGFATLYEQTDGKHAWLNAASGTAGNAITFTQAMTLDASGNLGVGTSSPTAKFDAFQSSVGTYFLGGGGDNKLRQLAITSSTTTNSGDTHTINAQSGTGILAFAITGAEKARIDSSGNLGIGITSPLDRLHVLMGTTPSNGTGIAIQGINSGGASSQPGLQFLNNAGTYLGGIYADNGTGFVGINAKSSNHIRFTINNAEIARFDSSGNLLVGVTSGSYHTLAKDIAGNWSTEIRNSNATPYGLYIRFSGAAPNGSVNEFLYCGDTVGQKMAIRSNGGIANFSGSNVNLSDRREKTNFAPAKSYLNVICAIPVQTFNYIDQDMKDDGGLTLGVVAQDVQAVAPELVMESNWANKNEEPKMRLSIYQTDLQFALMKCIQEQQALITQLQADVAALKGA